MESQIGIAVSVLVSVKETENGTFLARCPFLNIVSQGDTDDGAVAQLRKEMSFLFETCLADGTLEAVLDQRTATRRAPPALDKTARVERAYVDLPAGIPAELLKRFRDAAASAA